jgi:hypothetical protein
MSTTKTRTPPSGATGANASKESNYTINPEIESKIDDWIKNNEKSWSYIQTLPRDRLERTVVLNDVRRIEARERIDGEIMTKINNDPTRKQAYDILTKDMSEEQREHFILRMERENRRATQQQSQTQTQAKREGVKV